MCYNLDLGLLSVVRQMGVGQNQELVMIRNVKIIFSICVCFVLGFPSDAVCVELQYKLVSVAGQPSYVEICGVNDCRKINLPTLDYSASYTLLDLPHRREKIIVAKPVEGAMDVNFCVNIYLLTPDNFVNELRVEDDSLCNVTIHENKIVSRYRNAAKWYDVVYRLSFSAIALIKELVDECVGCGYIARTEYNSDGGVRNNWIMSDAKNYWERKKITAQLIVDKAWLYNSPNSKDKTKMYLIKNDIVVLKKEQVSGDGLTWFYLVTYQAKNHREITKWLESGAVIYDNADLPESVNRTV
jgi:hypothetical protein